MEPVLSEPIEPKPGIGRVVIVGRVLGSLGTVAIVSTLLTYTLTRELGWMIYGKTAFGSVALLVYLMTNSSELSRFFTARATLYSVATIIATGGFLVMMGALNFISALYNREYDLTPEKIHSLSDQTEKVLERLEKDVSFVGFYRPEEPERGKVEELLGRYRTLSKRISVDFINPETDPEAVKKYEITQSGPRLIVKVGPLEVKIRDIEEEDITNAIVKVAQQSTKLILFLTGHGEPDILDGEAEGLRDAATALGDEGYEVRPVALFDKQFVPEEAAGLVIVAPRAPLLQPEVDMIRGYLALGGHLMVMLEPGVDAGMRALLDDWRVALGDDVVIDPNPMSRAFGFGPEMPIIQKLEEHPITRGMKASLAFPSVRSIRALPGGGSRPKAVEVVKTSEQAWGETKYEAGATMAFETEDVPGPVPLMVASTKASAAVGAKPTDQSRLLVVGDHEFATNRFLVVLGNKDFFLNAVNWLAQEEERISVRPRARGGSKLLMTENQANFVKFFAIDLIPMTILAVGVAVWQVRRRK
ncbi:MAG: GldG family protein [Deltaproteobacteria bacterium]|nr:GldG family protein [Deltaproteobacteria bacterium]